MELVFERDPRKAESNRRKHKVSFDEAQTVFGDPYELMIPDPDHSGDEERSIRIGESNTNRILTVVIRRSDTQSALSARGNPMRTRLRNT